MDMDGSEADKKFIALKTKFSEHYNGHKYHWLKFCLFGIVHVSDLTDETCKAHSLLNKLDDFGKIKATNVDFLLEIANLSGLQKAKDLVNQYMSDNKVQNTYKEILSPYRKGLYKTMENVGPDDMHKVIEHYQLQKSTTMWDVVFQLEIRTELADDQDKIRMFASLLNPLARNKLLDNWTRIPINLKRRHPDSMQITSQHSSEHLQIIRNGKQVVSLVHDKHNDIEILLKRNGCTSVNLIEGSIIFDVCLYDPNALENIYEQHLNGKLLQDLAEILFVEKYRKAFEKAWELHISTEKFITALKVLTGKSCRSRMYLVQDAIVTGETGTTEYEPVEETILSDTDNDTEDEESPEENQVLKLQIYDLQKENEYLSGEVKVLKLQISDLQKALQEEVKEREKLSTELTKKKSKYKNIIQENESDIRDKKREIDSLKTEVNQQAMRNQLKDNEVIKLREEREDLRKQVQAYRKENEVSCLCVCFCLLGLIIVIIMFVYYNLWNFAKWLVLL